MADISRLRKQSVGVALGVISLPEKKSVRHKASKTKRYLRWRRYSSIPLAIAAVPVPFELQQCLQLCHHVGRTARRALEVALRRETAGLEHCVHESSC